MPWHIAIDQASERRLGKLQIGTTRRGIGPAYADKASRIGIRVQDVLDPKILRQKIEVALAEKNVWLERVYEVEPFDLEEVAARYEGYAQRLRPIVGDASLLVDEALRDGKEVLFEGAQGTLLDLDHGTYPFVTSSNPIASGAATGIGIGPTRIDRVLGVAKAYVTRVGEGPFPSEIEGPDQERVQELGGEFGTVTGRVRRCGWLDLVALRYAVRVNGITSLALTKLDVLSAFAELPVCVAYLLRDGSETDTSRRTRATSTTPARSGRRCRAGSSRSTPPPRATSLPAAARALRRVRRAGARRAGRARRCRRSARARARLARRLRNPEVDSAREGAPRRVGCARARARLADRDRARRSPSCTPRPATRASPRSDTAIRCAPTTATACSASP